MKNSVKISGIVFLSMLLALNSCDTKAPESQDTVSVSGIGKFISENSRSGFWGTGAIDTIFERLQQELPGLRGFSTGNIKRMCCLMQRN